VAGKCNFSIEVGELDSIGSDVPNNGFDHVFIGVHDNSRFGI
jgi:hypothetical protein